MFFSCLYSLYEYQDIIANGQSLVLTVNEQNPDKLIDELTCLCDKWAATINILV
ncbi:hypothetical protein KO505_13390 [Psychrosphaera sp. F3M07]|uniref:hypothetical protein n=1 Tax=Psychrosphaera sp. F3M07 TaxID=2841560 RepID=UPI001C0A1A11|nr:hypothetical protein [Psychrosphaera sp. F3M07]MBU2918943.1 hypothetical protein [Psychrosphaera sp. F3M07]